MSGVRGDAVDLLLCSVEGHGVRADVVHPERFLESDSKALGRVFLGRRERLVAAQSGESREAAPGRVGVALHLDERDRRLGQRPVTVADRVARVLPALVEQPALRVPLVLDQAVTVDVAVVVHPAQRGEGIGPQALDQLRVACPALVLVEQHQPQRRRIDRAVVRRVGDFSHSRQLALAQLVQDLARLCVAPVVDLGRLETGQDRQR